MGDPTQKDSHGKVGGCPQQKVVYASMSSAASFLMLVLDLPTSISLTASAAISLFGFAINSDCMLIFATRLTRVSDGNSSRGGYRS